MDKLPSLYNLFLQQKTDTVQYFKNVWIAHLHHHLYAVLSGGNEVDFLHQRDVSRDVGLFSINRRNDFTDTSLTVQSDFTGIGRCVPFSLALAPVIFGARAATPAELERIYAMARTLPARAFMSEVVQTAEEREDVAAVLHRMLAGGLKHVPVVRGGRPVGMVARHDLLKLLVRTGVLAPGAPAPG